MPFGTLFCLVLFYVPTFQGNILTLREKYGPLEKPELYNDTRKISNNTCTITENRTAADKCELKNITEDCYCSLVINDVACRFESRIPYMQFIFCEHEKQKSWRIISGLLLCLWLVFLFANVALLVDLRLVPNLATLSEYFNIGDVTAGVTLLALGNGAADIFTAMSSVEASPNGGELAISGLIGSALFLIFINTAVLSIWFEPTIEIFSVTRDTLVLMLTLGSVCYILRAETVQYWQAGGLFALYGLYISLVIWREQIRVKRIGKVADDAIDSFFQDMSSSEEEEDDELYPLLKATGEKAKQDRAKKVRTPVNSEYLKSSGEASIKSGLARHVAVQLTANEALDRIAACAARPQTPVIDENKESDAPVKDIPFWELYNMLDICSASEVKVLIFRALLMLLQAPARIILLFGVPVVLPGQDEAARYNRWLLVVNAIATFPLMIALLSVDALNTLDIVWSEKSTVTIILVVGASTLVLALISIGIVSRRHRATSGLGPIVLFAVLGLLSSLVIIFAVAQETVSIIISYAVWLELSPSFIGMITVGIGNGSADLLANFLVARKGFPQVALAAVLGGAVLNTLLGTAAFILFGRAKWGAYNVSFDFQIVTGLGFLATGSMFIFFRAIMNQFLHRSYGYTMLILYAAYLVTSLGLEIGYSGKRQ
eukprot:m.190723 g.190723  ORF g.190723 m.190723 type:complete len:660 (+) comp15643_c0_seq3:290-2269(+)